MRQRLLCVSFIQLVLITAFYQQIQAQTAYLSWNVTTRSSDYYMYLEHEFTGGKCDCSNVFKVNFSWNGGSKTVEAVNNKGTPIAVGPGQTKNFSRSGSINGKNKVVIFGCIEECSYTWNRKGGVSRTTRRIKSPVKFAVKETGLGYISLNWSKGTDIPDNKRYGYKIYRDGLSEPIATLRGSQTTFVDETAEPNRKYTYSVTTYTNEWGGQESVVVSIQASTQDVEFKASDGEFLGRTRINWSDISASIEEIQVWRDDELLETLQKEATSYTDNEGLPGYAYNYYLKVVRNGELKTYTALSDNGFSAPNGKISGKVTAPFGGPVEGVIVCAERIEDVPQGDNRTTYCDTTDATGFYEIQNIYYHESAEFRITPTKDDHGFNPGSVERTLDLVTPAFTNIDFVDTTSFTVTGRVVQAIAGDTCGLEGAEIWVNDVFRGVETDADGNFVLTVEEIGEYVFEARYQGHEMQPGTIERFIEEDTEGLVFANVQQQTLSGFVQAPCNIFIGQADLRIWSTDQGGACIDTTFKTQDGSGYYEIQLPARTYQMEMTGFSPTDPSIVNEEEMLTFFSVDTVDITLEDVENNFIYRRAPTILISGFPPKSCVEGKLPILEQGEIYDIAIEVLEVFGTDTCYADTGFVVVYDAISMDNPDPDTLPIQSGFAFYEVKAESPNIISPYHKLIEVVANVDGLTDQTDQKVIVTGNRPREKTFLSVSPELPFMILRDPPGDASYSYLSEATTTQTALRLFGQTEGSIKKWAEVKAGTKFEAGIGPIATETEAWGTIGGSIEVGARISGQSEYIMSLTNREYFSTSDNEAITGEEGDVFIGSAMNLIYAITDVIAYNADNCQIEPSVSVIVGNEGFATNFIYTEDHIRNVLVPQLQQLKDYYQEINPDSAVLYENQISVWEQTLTLNQDLKEDASFVENRSISALAPFESSQTISQETYGTIEFSMFMETEVAKEAGFEVAGSGASGGLSVRLKMELGSSATVAQLNERTTGYVLNDDDPGDFFSIDIKEDKTYGTPVFELVSGRSSCPMEPGTQPREGVQLISDSYVKTNVEPDDAADFRLNLGNTSQSDEEHTYELVFLQESNPEGAEITLGGSQIQGGVPTPYTIGPGGSRTATITIKRGPRAYTYQDLQFVLRSNCDPEAIADTASFSVFFNSPCSEITLHRPEKGWIVSSEDNNRLTLNVRDYVIEDLDQVKLEYAPEGTSDWNTIESFNRQQLETRNTGTSYVWNLDNVADGKYKIRAVVNCSGGLNYSQQAEGIIDRTAPVVFGLPEPVDGVYESGDVISVTFHEAINCFKLNKSGISLRNLSDDQSYDIEIGCSGNRLILIPQGNTTLSQGQYEVSIAPGSISDTYHNLALDTISWQFEVEGEVSPTTNPEGDTDEDLVINSVDNCAFAANTSQSDIDEDGVGDACDDDIDGDGIPNATDNCPYFANAGQEDSDGDGIGDVCEVNADGDGDGISNDLDNCPYVANPDQADQDNDGIGDVCDDDRDGDGIVRSRDNCDLQANPRQETVECKSEPNPGVSNVSDIRELDHLTIYPHPLPGEGWIELELSRPSDVKLSLHDIQGRVLRSWVNERLAAGKQRIPISAYQVAQGMYMLEIEINGRKIWEKIWIKP